MLISIYHNGTLLDCIHYLTQELVKYIMKANQKTTTIGDNLCLSSM